VHDRKVVHKRNRRPARLADDDGIPIAQEPELRSRIGLKEQDSRDAGDRIAAIGVRDDVVQRGTADCAVTGTALSDLQAQVGHGAAHAVLAIFPHDAGDRQAAG
jgi:hypothetical protein